MTIISSSLAVAGTDDPIVAASQIARLGGAVKVLTRAQFDAAVTAERTRVTNNGTGIYANGEQFHIIDEVGQRTWTLATGGSNAANAAASHARNVVLPSGVSVLLAADANTATLGSGAPGAGVGAVGDLVLDPAAGLTYTKTGGAVWGAGASAGGGGGASTASPAFTGVPTAPTATAGTNTTQLATTAFVAAAAALKQPLNARVDLANQAASVTLTAATTVDVVGVECLAITQTTASITLTLPAPTVDTLHRELTVENVGSVAVTVAGADSFALNAGESRQWRWNGTSWKMRGTMTAAQTVAVTSLVAGSRIVDVSSRNISVLDSGALLAPSGTLTYTIPAGLSPMPSFTIDCPPSGTISIARGGATTLNGAATTLTRTRASNPVGVVVLAHAEVDSYGVSGA